MNIEHLSNEAVKFENAKLVMLKILKYQCRICDAGYIGYTESFQEHKQKSYI